MSYGSDQEWWEKIAAAGRLESRCPVSELGDHGLYTWHLARKAEDERRREMKEPIVQIRGRADNGMTLGDLPSGSFFTFGRRTHPYVLTWAAHVSKHRVHDHSIAVRYTSLKTGAQYLVQDARTLSMSVTRVRPVELVFEDV